MFILDNITEIIRFMLVVYLHVLEIYFFNSRLTLCRQRWSLLLAHKKWNDPKGSSNNSG